ncbi:WxL protein peptidoglycan domain-containing protein [Streptomyces sp. NPDC001422]|uniref:WxL protein peptidoglycan domain-containing protein n=1 Tax=Streptomyces sp. NPDC001422 TaxID=3364575 RepID=UPI0036B93057
MHAPAAHPPAPPAFWRTLILLTLATLAFLVASLTPARAADGNVTWTVRTATNGYGSDRSSYNYNVNPGGQVKDAMVVANRGKSPLVLTVYAADGYTTEKGQLDLLTDQKKSRSIGAWVHATHSTVRIPAGKTAQVPFTVTVPRNATPGDYVGGVLTSLKQADDSQGINVDRRLGIRIKLRVSGPLKPALAIEDLHVGYHGNSTPFSPGTATVTYTLHNTGNALLSGTQEVTLTGPFGMLRTDAGRIASPPELLPGERWKVSVPVHDVAAAIRITAKASITPALTDAAGSTSSLKPLEATTTGWAVPWTLFLGLALAGAAAITVFLYRRRNRGRRAEREEARVRRAVEEALRGRAQQKA